MTSTNFNAVVEEGYIPVSHSWTHETARRSELRVKSARQPMGLSPWRAPFWAEKKTFFRKKSNLKFNLCLIIHGASRSSVSQFERRTWQIVVII